MERIDKVISTLMCISRSDSRRLIKIGKVYVDGVRVKAFDTKVDENSEIIADGKKISFSEKIYIMMNKRNGTVCDDKDNSPYVIKELEPKLKRKDLFCVGRLDKDTTGLLLITNDGDFAHKVIAPKSGIKKRYRAELEKEITLENISQIRNGITLRDKTKLLPADVEIIDDNSKIVDFIVEEGKYHQIKRMAGAIDNKVISLNRMKIGSLELYGNLRLGEAVEITKEEAYKVFI